MGWSAVPSATNESQLGDFGRLLFQIWNYLVETELKKKKKDILAPPTLSMCLMLYYATLILKQIK